MEKFISFEAPIKLKCWANSLWNLLENVLSGWLKARRSVASRGHLLLVAELVREGRGQEPEVRDLEKHGERANKILFDAI